MCVCDTIFLWPNCAHASIRGCDTIKPYPYGTKAARHVRIVSGHLIDRASARARRLRITVNQGLMTIAMNYRQTSDLARRGRSVPKAKQPSPAGVLLTAAPIALAAEAGGGALYEGSCKSLLSVKSAKASRGETATKAKERARLQVLTAPLDGTIVEVAVTTVGERVEAGAPLMTLVPLGQELVIEALVLNKDVGFIKVGDNASVKLEAFPFTRYGFLKGKVDRVAADAVTDERRGLVFPVRIRVESQTLTSARRNQSEVNGGAKASAPARNLSLSPGMAASVEIATGERRVIDFVLSPIAKATSEAGRER